MKGKRILSVMLAILMVMSVFSGLEISTFASDGFMPSTSQSGTYSSDDFDYYITESGTITIFGYTGDETDVVIPESIGGYSVTSLSSTYSTMSEIEPEYYTNVKSITIPASVTIIDSAFCISDTLEEIIVDEDNEYYSSVDGVLFNKAQTYLILFPAAITGSYEITEGVTNVWSYAFTNSSLTSLTLSSTVKSFSSIDRYSDYPTSLEEIIVDEDNEYFSSVDGVLYNIDMTKLVYYPNGKTSSSYTLPSTVTSGVEASQFYNCSYLKNIYVEDGNTAYSSVNGVLFDEDETQLIYYPAGKTATSYSIPDGTTAVSTYAFTNCGLTKISLPNSLCDVYDYDFLRYAENLTYIEVDDDNEFYASEDGILFSKDGTVLYCYPAGITGSYTVPSNIETIENYSFYNSSLSSIEINDNVTSIDWYAFAYSDIESITLPSGLTKISNSLFAYCSYLTEVNLPESITSISSRAFFGCTSLESIEIPDSVSDIGWQTFAYCTSLKSVELSNSLTEIGQSCFAFCSSLEEITIPDGVEAIGFDAFYYCSSLKEITIPESVTEIYEHAFARCSSLNAITVLSSDCEIGIHYSWGTEYEKATFPDTAVLCGYSGSTLEEYAETYDRVFHDLDEGAHEYEQISSTDPTCTESGYLTYECPVCGDSYTEELSATGHSYTWTTSNGSIEYECSVCGIKGTLPFTDISDETEYYPYIAYTSCFNSLITGVKANSTDTTTTTFSPRTSLTRAMLVTILYRMAGSPYDDANPYTSTPFSDVKAGTWYYDAVCWALDNGITTETKFKPNTNVTREQTATFLYRYAGEYLGEDVLASNSISSFPDSSSVSSYAKTAMKWAYANGMITGTQQGYLNPQGTTLRVHATKILYNFGFAYNIGNFS